MNRITDKMLERMAGRINEAFGIPKWTNVWNRVGDRNVATIGMYHLSGAYGGKSLHKVCNDGGGVEDVFGCGHISNRDLYNRMDAFLQGIIAARS